MTETFSQSIQPPDDGYTVSPDLVTLMELIPGRKAYVGEGYYVGLCTYSPCLLDYLLTNHNPDNREVSKGQVNWLSRIIARDEFVLTGETIIFSSVANLLNGQHRGLGAVDAGKAIRAFTVFGIDRATAFPVLDQGLKRKLADALRQMGYEKNCQLFDHALKVLFEYLSLGMIRGKKPLLPDSTTPVLLDLLSGHPSLYESVSYVTDQASCRVLNHKRSIVVALHYMFRLVDREAADDMLYRIKKRSIPTTDDWSGPLKFAESVDREMDKTDTRGGRPERGINREYYAAYLIKAWNFMRQQKRVNRISYDRTKEAFPTISGLSYNRDRFPTDQRLQTVKLPSMILATPPAAVTGGDETPEPEET